MKRLLLAPLLFSFIPPISALPFLDIVVKTDIGEKYIVKDSTVVEINMTEFKKQKNLYEAAVYARSIHFSALEDAANCATKEREKYNYLKDVPLGNPPPKSLKEIRDNLFTWEPKYQKFYEQKLSSNCGYKIGRIVILHYHSFFFTSFCVCCLFRQNSICAMRYMKVWV